MDATFSAAFTGQLEALLDGLRFVRRSTGVASPIDIYESMVPRMTPDQVEGDDPPFVRWCIYAGEFSDRGLSSFELVVDFGIYTPGSIVDGSRELLTLTRRLSGLAGMSGFAPYKLQKPLSFRLGHPDADYEGVQPHPYHYGRLKLEFVYQGDIRRCPH